MVENEWRDTYCTDSEHLYCSCPYNVITCPGAWDCTDLELLTSEVMYYWDTNGDGTLSLADNINE